MPWCCGRRSRVSAVGCSSARRVAGGRGHRRQPRLPTTCEAGTACQDSVPRRCLRLDSLPCPAPWLPLQSRSRPFAVAAATVARPCWVWSWRAAAAWAKTPLKALSCVAMVRRGRRCTASGGGLIPKRAIKPLVLSPHILIPAACQSNPACGAFVYVPRWASVRAGEQRHLCWCEGSPLPRPCAHPSTIGPTFPQVERLLSEGARQLVSSAQRRHRVSTQGPHHRPARSAPARCAGRVALPVLRRSWANVAFHPPSPPPSFLMPQCCCPLCVARHARVSPSPAPPPTWRTPAWRQQHSSPLATAAWPAPGTPAAAAIPTPPHPRRQAQPAACSAAARRPRRRQTPAPSRQCWPRPPRPRGGDGHLAAAFMLPLTS